MRNRPSANVCTVCRNRKVKCDGRPGGCENCARLNYTCSFSLPEGSDGLLSSPNGTNELPRRRARLACQPCKAQKARCSGEQPACIRCRHKNIECIYLPSKRTKVAPAPLSTGTRVSIPTAVASASTVASSPSTPASFIHEPMMRPTAEQGRAYGAMLHYDAQGPTMGSEACYEAMKSDRHTVKACIDAFFNVLYPSPEYSFIHKAVFLQMWQAGDIDAVLLKAVCGVAARFVPGQTQAGKDQGVTWIDEAQAELLTSFEKPAVVRLQALQLVVLHCQAMRQFRRLLFLFSLCTRMAFLLRLNYEDPALPFLAQESRRRLMWSIFVTDTVLGGGTPDFVLCPARKVHIRLPAEEPSFQLDRAVETEPLRPDPSHPPSHTIGLLAYFIRVMDIRDRVLRFTKDISNESIDPSSMANHFQGFEYELDRLRNSLPANMAFSAKNLSLRAYSKNSLPRFVLLHVWWHQCHCDLFRFLIPGFRESVSGQMMRRIPSDLSHYCRTQCIAHARSLADIFHLLVTLDQDVPFTDATLVVPAYQCANILCRSQKMAGMAGQFDITAGVKACLEVTQQLAQYNTMAAVISEDIQKLVEYGAPSASHSRHRTPENADGDRNKLVSPSGTEMPRYKFSRHNIVDAANVRDDGADLGYRNAPVVFSPASEDPPRSASGVWTGTPVAQQQNIPPLPPPSQAQHSHGITQPQGPPPPPAPPAPQQQQTPQTQHTPQAQQTPHQTPQPTQHPTLAQQPLPPAPGPAAVGYPQTMMPPPVDPLQQQVALQQQSYAAQNPNAIMSLSESNDWTWDMPMSGQEQGSLDFLFDPLWRIHNQWDVRS